MNTWANAAIIIQRQVEGLTRPVIVVDAANVGMKEKDGTNYLPVYWYRKVLRMQ